jgi:hypothetical protein
MRVLGLLTVGLHLLEWWKCFNILVEIVFFFYTHTHTDCDEGFRVIDCRPASIRMVEMFVVI